jgi:NAD(P)-dependent dehydrogenase (short-subunit alcohol dehydrogenase family)
VTRKVAVITGASSGLGTRAAVSLAEQGWELAVVGRNPERTHAVALDTGGEPFIADYDRLDDVRSLAAALLHRYPRIDVLANNAGGLVNVRGRSADGHERTIQHNHLAPFLLTNLLLERLERSNARVIATASIANRWAQLDLDDLDFDRRPYLGGWRAYGTSKLAEILFTRELARRSSVGAYAFHPGYVATGFGQDTRLLKFAQFVGRGHLGRTPDQGAAPLVHLATVDTVPAPSGTYFDGLAPNGRVHRMAKDDALAAALWERSANLVGLTDGRRPSARTR